MDFMILDWLQSIRTPFLDAVMPVITMLGDKGLFWIAVAIILVIIPKTRRTGFVVAAALLFDVLFCNCLIKPLVARVRPYDVKQTIQLLIEKPTDYSFPSGHTAASFAAATALLFDRKKVLGGISLALAFLIAFSRLYLYVHYPTDVLGGMILGTLCGFAGYMVVKQVLKKIDEKKNSRQENTEKQ